MKYRLLILIIILIFSFISCGFVPLDKNYAVKNNISNSKFTIFGDWEWVESYLNIDTSFFYYPSQYTTKTITFTRDGEFLESKNDKIYFNEKYIVKSRISIFDGQRYDALIIDEKHDQLIEYHVYDDEMTLVLTENIESGSTLTYYKIKPIIEPNTVPRPIIYKK